MCRRTRQRVAFVIGDRSEQSCLRLWDKVPLAYRPCLCDSDFWKAYQEVLPQETHCAVGKESGQVSHRQRWYCTLRQRQARYVGKTLSFTKSDTYHHRVTNWFIIEHNLAMKSLLSPLTIRPLPRKVVVDQMLVECVLDRSECRKSPCVRTALWPNDMGCATTKDIARWASSMVICRHKRRHRFRRVTGATRCFCTYLSPK